MRTSCGCGPRGLPRAAPPRPRSGCSRLRIGAERSSARWRRPRAAAASLEPRPQPVRERGSMNAVIYIVETLLSLALFVVLARLLLQLTRADFRNPLCQAIVQLTNPLIVPLRRVLPPIGKVDTASVVAVLLVAGVEV